jgi:hypothetical protein
MNRLKPEPRSRRRADLARMKAKARRVYPEMPHPEKVANHLKPMSWCRCCSNPRRWRHGPERFTMQERRALAE